MPEIVMPDESWVEVAVREDSTTLESEIARDWRYLFSQLEALRRDPLRILPPIPFRVGGASLTPDVALVRADRAAHLHDGFVDGPPDLVIELFSTEKMRALNWNAKREAYERGRTPELWLVDLSHQEVAVLVLEGDRLQPVTPDHGGRLASRAIPRLRVDPDWFFDDPRPDPRQLMARILATWLGSPAEPA